MINTIYIDGDYTPTPQNCGHLEPIYIAAVVGEHYDTFVAQLLSGLSREK